MGYKVGDIIYHKVIKKFYRISSINNNGTIKAYGVYDNKLLWTAWNDKMIVHESEATL